MYNLNDDYKLLRGLFILIIISIALAIALSVSLYTDYKKVPDYTNIVVNSTEYILDREEQKAVSDFISYLQEVE